MGDLFKSFEKFLFRDMSFVLGGSVVIASATHVFNIQSLAPMLRVYINSSAIKLFIAVGVAYVIGYSVQELFTFGGLVRTRANHPPNRLGESLYWLSNHHHTRFFHSQDPFDESEYNRAKLWLYEKAPQHFCDEQERTESLKQVGTTIGPCFLISGGIFLFCKQTPIGMLLVLGGLFLILLGWLKVTQQLNDLIALFRDSPGFQ